MPLNIKHMNGKKIAAALAVPVLFALVAVLAAPFMVDTDKVSAQLAHVTAQYGLTFEASGQPSVSALPAPHISYANVSLSDENGEEVVQIPSLNISLGWLGIFSDALPNVALTDPTIRLQSRHLHEWMNNKASNANTAQIRQISVGNARIQFIADENAGAFLADGLSMLDVSANYAPAANGAGARLNASFQWHEQPVSLKLRRGAAGQKLSGELAIGKLLQTSFDGALNAENAFRWQGNVDTKLSDALALSHWFAKKSKQEASAKGEPPEAAAQATYPLSFSSTADITADGLLIHRSDAMFREAKTAFALYVGWADFISIAIELKPSKLQADEFIRDFAIDLLPSTKSKSAFAAPLVVEVLPDYVNLVLLMQAQEVALGDKTYRNLDIAAELDQSDVELHYANMDMPGEARLTLDGTIKQLPEGRRFSGKADIRGEKFNAWLANFEPMAIHLPKEDFSKFRVSGNLFISKEQLRLSEADLNIGELGFQGGFAAFFDQVPRVEAEIRLSEINLDYFRDIWRDSQQQDKVISPLAGDRASFDWLRRLPAVLDFRIIIDQFTFLDTPGTRASTRLYAKPGELLLSGLDMRMLNNVISGNVRLNVEYTKPSLSVVLTGSAFNTDYIDRGVDTESAPLFQPNMPDARWSEQLFDVSLLNQINGAFDISIGTLTHNNVPYGNFKWLAELNDRTLNIKSLSFKLLGGTFGLSGSIIGGSVPGISASYSLYNADLKAIISQLFGINTIDGRVSLSGVIGTSGIHPKAWLEQGEMKITAAARGVRVRNFNLQGIIDAAKEARSTMDIQRSTKELLFDGLTELAVDGNINIKGGIMRTPGLKLGYGRAIGSLLGELNLKDWQANLSTNWQLPELSSSTIPTINVSLQGDLNDLKTRVDSSSLEAFVAKRIVGQ